MAFLNFLPMAPGQEFLTYTDRRWPLGTVGRTEDGRVFRFALMGATAAVAGSLYQATVPVANHVGLTPTAAAVGATVISVTLGATAISANDYRDGQVSVDVTTGTSGGITYMIGAHPAVLASGVFAVPLKENHQVQVAIAATANTVSLYHSEYWKVIVAATSYTQRIVGVAPVVIAAASYGWLQTQGPAFVLTQGTVVIAEPVVGSATTAGACSPVAAGGSETTQVIGTCMHVGATTNFSLIRLSLEAGS